MAAIVGETGAAAARARRVPGARIFAAVLLVAGAASAAACGEIVAVTTHGGTTTRYAYVAAERGATALVLLVGGAGHPNLDDNGCPRALKGNSLVRSLPHFHASGFATALVDAPSDHQQKEGLAGFRVEAEHARDIGRVIADVRGRSGGPVWLVGTSRGAISAANAASRLTGDAAPDGVVLTSAVMVGDPGARLPWVAHSVFNADLAAIRQPTLLVGHAEDTCVRSPAGAMSRVASLIGASRKQVVTVTGGPGGRGLSGFEACEGRSPHGYIGQEAEVVAGIARFVRGGNY